MPGKVILETKNLKKYFHTGAGELHAVDDISISIKEGCTLGVVGESGCGKSTLGRTILRLIEPTSGTVLFDGKDITAASKKEMRRLRADMQIIFQDPYASLNPRMTISETIAQPMLVNKLCKRSEAETKVRKLMDTVGLASRLYNAYPHELDGGRRQRIGIARALSLNPRFIVCDEPVSALDVSIQAQILNLLMDLQEERKLTYMFITHNLSVVKHISDEIMVMYLGQCIERAKKTELFKNPKHPYTQALLDAIPSIDPDKRNKKRKSIKGEIVSPIDPPPGCRFEPRCPHASKECLGRDIPLKDIGGGHQVKCVLFK
ncbi:MAG: ABC transporter ATP-binding protein [Christensenellales bacterium]|jgi:peptide/nickel transport system ATP-binding protein